MRVHPQEGHLVCRGDFDPLQGAAAGLRPGGREARGHPHGRTAAGGHRPVLGQRGILPGGGPGVGWAPVHLRQSGDLPAGRSGGGKPRPGFGLRRSAGAGVAGRQPAPGRALPGGRGPGGGGRSGGPGGAAGGKRAGPGTGNGAAKQPADPGRRGAQPGRRGVRRVGHGEAGGRRCARRTRAAGCTWRARPG